MEGEAPGDGGDNGGAGTRWNPTKDQIAILETIYKEGIRTPSAEQIQQITARLRAYGHIEGKNVFYWFQNHKARHRQKQRQERLAFLNCLGAGFHHHHRHPPLLHGGADLGSHFSYPSVTYNPYGYNYQHPNNNFTFYNSQYKTDRPCRSTVRNPAPPSHEEGEKHGKKVGVKTLNLFPLHPTGILDHKFINNNNVSDFSSFCFSDVDDCNRGSPNSSSGHRNDVA